MVVDNPNGLPLNIAPRTYMGWICLNDISDSITSWRVIFDQGPSVNSAGGRVRFQTYGSTFQLDLDGTQINASPPTQVSGWTHFAVSWDGNAWKIYINGSLLTTQSGVNFNTLFGPLYLGKANPDAEGSVPPFGLNGILDQFSIRTGALTADEISAAANN